MVQDDMDDALKAIKEAKQLKTVQLLFQLLPRDNYRLLEQVLSLLHDVSRKEESKMTADTLGTLFAPCILVPRKVGIISSPPRFSFVFPRLSVLKGSFFRKTNMSFSFSCRWEQANCSLLLAT